MSIDLDQLRVEEPVGPTSEDVHRAATILRGPNPEAHADFAWAVRIARWVAREDATVAAIAQDVAR